MKDDEIYKKHILEAIGKIDFYLQGIAFIDFSSDAKLFDATVRQLEIIGEASTHFGEEFRRMHPSIPFNKIIRMRNKMIHEYFGVDEQVVWETCKKDLPELKRVLSEK